ncbi:MAG: glycosyltransferase, partial [Gammaproteobacteria bacterium]
MNILHVCFSDKGGGAFIGAHRLHTCMRDQGISSELLVIIKRTDDPTVIEAPFHLKLQNFVWRNLSKLVLKLQDPGDREFRSMNIFPTTISNIINKSDADIVQFHWISSNTVGLPDFGRIKKPIVWKMPDMWAFCGSEHYTYNYARFIDGYAISNRPAGHRGLDIDRYVWRKKRHYWQNKDFCIVCPSRWLARCAGESILFRDRPIHIIPNPINMEIYKPTTDKVQLRKNLNLPPDKKLILFTSLQKINDPRKGFHYLDKCMEQLTQYFDTASLGIVVMGKELPPASIHGIDVYFTGYSQEDLDIVSVYAACDACFFPSMADSTPNTIKESMCCGTPCVAFDIEGVQEMISHKINGYLAPPGAVGELAEGLKWILSGANHDLSRVVRESACRLHDPHIIVRKYLEIYENILA